MEPSLPRQDESPAKGAANESVEPGSIGRFKKLARHLFGVDRGDFKEAAERDERQRRAKRGQ